MPGELRDPAVGLTCEETPFYPPKAMAIGDMPKCESCSLIFTAPIAGTKIIGQRSGMDGLSVQESPLCELHYNTNKYALYDTILWAKQGAHRNFKAAKNYDMEMNLYFRDVFDQFKIIAAAIPIVIDDRRANPYFTEMADQNASIRNITLENIISDGPIIMYKGMDLRNRNSDKPYAAEQCQSKTASITWLVLQPTYISSNDAKRFRTMNHSSNLLPPVPVHELTLARVRDMCAVIENIKKKSDKEKETKPKSDNGVFLTRALQCQRINPSTDIKGDAVYLNSKPQNTLHDELNSDAADSKVNLKNNSSWRPKQIENLIALILGIVVGLLTFAVLSYYFMHFIFKGYVSGAEAMEAAIISYLKKRNKDCEKVNKSESSILPELPVVKAINDITCASTLTKNLQNDG